MLNIDLGTVMQKTVSNGYGDLVTRHTGRAVRGGIEKMLANNDGRQVTVIDFGAVRCLDISCADEIVGRLLVDHAPGHQFALGGVTEAHCEAINLVLERRGRAVVAQSRDGSLQVLGPLDDSMRRAFGAVLESDVPTDADVTSRLALTAEAARPLLDQSVTQHTFAPHSDQNRTCSA